MTGLLLSNSRQRTVSPEQFGGKGAGVYRLRKLSRRLGYKVPEFFVVPTDYDGPEGNIQLRAKYLGEGETLAVRSSSPFEDSREHSFAGVFDSQLDVSWQDVVDATREVRKSALSEKAVDYAQERGITLDDRMAVIVQRMVRSDLGGVIYSTEPSYPIAASVQICRGGPSGVVDGSTDIKTYDVDKETLNVLFESEGYLRGDREHLVHDFEWSWRDRSKSMKDGVRISQALEETLGYPCDIEFAWQYNRKLGSFYLLQARPTTEPISDLEEVELPKVKGKRVVLKSKVVRGIGEYEGPVVFEPMVLDKVLGARWLAAEHLEEMDRRFSDGYVLVVPHFSDYLVDYDKVTPNKRAIVEYGGENRSSHALTVAREKGVLYMGKGFYLDEEVNSRVEKRIASRIKTGDTVKVVLDGRMGVAFKP